MEQEQKEMGQLKLALLALSFYANGKVVACCIEMPLSLCSVSFNLINLNSKAGRFSSQA